MNAIKIFEGVHTMNFTVTQEHIDQGCQINGHKCPVALAIKTQLPGVSVCVDTSSIRIGFKQYPISLAVRKFIRRFDNFSKPKPRHGITFSLPIEEPPDA